MRLRIASSQALHPSFCPFGAKAQSRRCSSLPHQTHFVGLCWGPRDLFRQKFVCKTLGNTAQMCLRATADLFRRKFVIFSCHTQSMPAKNCLFPTQNLWLNPRRQFMRYCPKSPEAAKSLLRGLSLSNYTLNRKLTTSPSCITYSLPSERTSPLARAAARVPHSWRSW